MFHRKAHRGSQGLCHAPPNFQGLYKPKFFQQKLHFLKQIICFKLFNSVFSVVMQNVFVDVLFSKVFPIISQKGEL